MSGIPQKINNSYESGSSSSSTGSGGDQILNFEDPDPNRITDGVAGLMEGADLYNTSVEEGIFPNVGNRQPEVPSYSRQWDDYLVNDYSNTPLVYSWLPIVPGFTEDGADNLHNFEHIQLRSHNVTGESDILVEEEIADQNEKYRDKLAKNSEKLVENAGKSVKSYEKFNETSSPPGTKLLNQNGMEFHELDNDSCNAVDLNISISEKQTMDPDLSFNGKIAGLKQEEKFLDSTRLDDSLNISEIARNIKVELSNSKSVFVIDSSFEASLGIPSKLTSDFAEYKDEHLEQFQSSYLELPGPSESKVIEILHDLPGPSGTIPQSVDEPEETEEQRLHNESLELLKLEDSSRMLLLNEKSPEPSFEEIISDNEQIPETDLKDCDRLQESNSSVLQKLRTSLAGICPPPSVTRFQMSLTDMLTTYHKNSNEILPAESFVKNSSFFVPTHEIKEVIDAEWPMVSNVMCLDVAYNKSTDSEHIEELCLRYSEKFIGAETATSFNFKIGASSAKKKIEKLKLATQSPGRRLSHLAKRRTIFSSDSLKSSSVLSSSHSSFASRILIDKKLLAKTKSPKKRTSAKKKTPKRRTPRSAKRQSVATQPETSSRASSKRALFTSPAEAKPSTSQQVVIKEIPERGRLPRRTLFSPDEQKKRRRSPEIDTENRFQKQRRLFSPTKLPKSQSFSVAPSTSTSTDHCRKKLFERTQSELVVAQSSSFSSNKKSLGFTQPLTGEHKQKLLWSVSSVLKSKNIASEHENFKKFATDLSKLVKKVFLEFYDPSNPSVSKQMQRFANYMVAFVIKGEDLSVIYGRTKALLLAKHSTRLTGYLTQREFELTQRRNNSLLMASQSFSSLNLSHQSETSFSGSTLNLSSSSLNRSSSKSNDVSALRENFLSSTEKSAKKFGSESNISKPPPNVNSNILKAKRQISF